MTRLVYPTLCLVLGPEDCAGRPIADVVGKAVRGGVTMVQLRDKTASDAAFVANARALLDILAGTGVPLILNDRAHLVGAVGAQGLHIGQSDLDPHEARALIGSDRLLGFSARTADAARAARSLPVDYLGTGAVFGSATKSDSPRIGVEGLAEVCHAAGQPVLAIGGIRPDRLPDLAATGAHGIAVVSAIAAAPDPQAAAATLIRLLKESTA